MGGGGTTRRCYDCKRAPPPILLFILQSTATYKPLVLHFPLSVLHVKTFITVAFYCNLSKATFISHLPPSTTSLFHFPSILMFYPPPPLTSPSQDIFFWFSCDVAASSKEFDSTTSQLIFISFPLIFIACSIHFLLNLY